MVEAGAFEEVQEPQVSNDEPRYDSLLVNKDGENSSERNGQEMPFQVKENAVRLPINTSEVYHDHSCEIDAVQEEADCVATVPSADQPSHPQPDSTNKTSIELAGKEGISVMSIKAEDSVVRTNSGFTTEHMDEEEDSKHGINPSENADKDTQITSGEHQLGTDEDAVAKDDVNETSEMPRRRSFLRGPGLAALLGGDLSDASTDSEGEDGKRYHESPSGEYGEIASLVLRDIAEAARKPPPKGGRTSEGGGPSQFRGVVWHKSNCKWEARIYENGKQRFLGYFTNEDEAALAYDEHALRLHGRNAKLNFPAHWKGVRLPPIHIFPGRSNAPRSTSRQKSSNRYSLGNKSLAASLSIAGARSTRAVGEKRSGRVQPVKGTSRFRGVSWNSNCAKWRAQVWKGSDVHHLGYFEDEVDAARAYDEAVIRIRGPNAPTNFPRSEYEGLGGIDGDPRRNGSCIKSKAFEGLLRNNLDSIRRRTGKKSFPRFAPPWNKDIENSSAFNAKQQGWQGRPSSRMLGVSWSSKHRAWLAEIWDGDAYQSLGVYGTEMEAARAYDLACLKQHAADALTNFPLKEYEMELAAMALKDLAGSDTASNSADGETNESDARKEEDVSATSVKPLDETYGVNRMKHPSLSAGMPMNSSKQAGRYSSVRNQTFDRLRGHPHAMSQRNFAMPVVDSCLRRQPVSMSLPSQNVRSAEVQSQVPSNNHTLYGAPRKSQLEPGVSWDNKEGRWMSQIQYQGKMHFLGYFDSSGEASAAYEAALGLLYGPANYMSSAGGLGAAKSDMQSATAPNRDSLTTLERLLMTQNRNGVPVRSTNGPAWTSPPPSSSGTNNQIRAPGMYDSGAPLNGPQNLMHNASNFHFTNHRQKFSFQGMDSSGDFVAQQQVLGGPGPHTKMAASAMHDPRHTSGVTHVQRSPALVTERVLQQLNGQIKEFSELYKAHQAQLEQRNHLIGALTTMLGQQQSTHPAPQNRNVNNQHLPTASSLAAPAQSPRAVRTESNNKNSSGTLEALIGMIGASLSAARRDNDVQQQKSSVPSISMMAALQKGASYANVNQMQSEIQQRQNRHCTTSPFPARAGSGESSKGLAPDTSLPSGSLQSSASNFMDTLQRLGISSSNPSAQIDVHGIAALKRALDQMDDIKREQSATTLDEVTVATDNQTNGRFGDASMKVGHPDSLDDLYYEHGGKRQKTTAMVSMA